MRVEGLEPPPRGGGFSALALRGAGPGSKLTQSRVQVTVALSATGATAEARAEANGECGAEAARGSPWGSRGHMRGAGITPSPSWHLEAIRGF